MEAGERTLVVNREAGARQTATGLSLVGATTTHEPQYRVGVRGASPDGLPMAGASGAPGLHLALAPRITSYNVCYTKLLRWRWRGGPCGAEARCRGDRGRAGGADGGDMSAPRHWSRPPDRPGWRTRALAPRITSYNVCYTKLLRISI